jgi:hypothetical protein
MYMQRRFVLFGGGSLCLLGKVAVAVEATSLDMARAYGEVIADSLALAGEVCMANQFSDQDVVIQATVISIQQAREQLASDPSMAIQKIIVDAQLLEPIVGLVLRENNLYMTLSLDVLRAFNEHRPPPATASPHPPAGLQALATIYRHYRLAERDSTKG